MGEDMNLAEFRRDLTAFQLNELETQARMAAPRCAWVLMAVREIRARREAMARMQAELDALRSLADGYAEPLYDRWAASSNCTVPRITS
jgi:hypothetical protein